MRWISAADLARKLNISREGVRKAIIAGRIKSYRKNGRNIQCDAVRAIAEFRGEEVPVIVDTGEEISDQKTSDDAKERTAHGFMTWGSNTPEKMPEVGTVSTGVNAETTKSEAERCRTIYKAERERLELLQLEKTLVPATQVRMDAYKIGREVMQNLTNLADRLSFEFAGETDAAVINQTLTREIIQCCEGLAAAGEDGA